MHASHSQRLWLAQQGAVQTLRGAVKALGERARVMPLKGVLLNQAHRAKAPRALSDCDVLLSGITLEGAVRVLESAGFSLVEWSRDSSVATLRPAGVGRPCTLDVHTRPAPLGYGGLRTAWLFAGARRDEALFGVPVWLPSDAGLWVHLLANAQRDQLHFAYPHTRDDLRLVLAALGETGALLAALSQVRLRGTAALALDWMAQHDAPTPLERALREALALSRREEAVLALRARWLTPVAGARAPRLRSQLAARMASDLPAEWALGVAATLWGVARHRLR